MRLTGVSRAVGLRLARDLPAGAGGVPLLQRGATVTERYARALAERGFRAVWVEDDLSAGIEPVELLGEPERGDAARRIRAFRETARAAASSSRPLQSAALGDMTGLAGARARVAEAPETGLLSFGEWQSAPRSRTRTARSWPLPWSPSSPGSRWPSCPPAAPRG